MKNSAAEKRIPDCILFNGTFLSMNGNDDIYSSVAITDGRITAAAKDDSLLARRGFGTAVEDLDGKTVLPGFIDCNVHTIQRGIGQYCINLQARTREEFLERLSQMVTEYEEGELIWCIGFEPEGQNLNRWDLDKVSSNHPIVVSRMEFHSTLVNTSAYNLLSIPFQIRGVEKDASGMPTGVLRGEASGFARRKMNRIFVSGHMRETAFTDTVREAVRSGITTLNAMEGGYFFSDEDVETVRKLAPKSPLDVLIYPQTMDVDEAVRYGMGRIGGNIYIDGTIGSKTAALYEPYEGESGNNGMLYYRQEELNQFVLDAHERHLQIALSCIGERAIDQALNAFDAAFRIAGKQNHRHRLELFVLPTGEQIERAVAMGLLFSMRPNYNKLWGGPEGGYRRNIGERYRRANPIGTVVRLGGIVAGGSESGVTPLPPMTGIHSAVNHSQESERVSVLEALKMYTCNAAYANFIEDRTGSIAVGMDADLAVLSRNPLETPAEELEQICVLRTIKRGTVVYG